MIAKTRNDANICPEMVIHTVEYYTAEKTGYSHTQKQKQILNTYWWRKKASQRGIGMYNTIYTKLLTAKYLTIFYFQKHKYYLNLMKIKGMIIKI